MSVELKKELKELEDEIYFQAGETFNLNSPKQLSAILFEKMGIKAPKKTATGYSTAADVLESLKEDPHRRENPRIPHLRKIAIDLCRHAARPDQSAHTPDPSHLQPICRCNRAPLLPGS